MRIKNSHKQEGAEIIPKWMIWTQCLCFSVLYAIWALPETILIRHVCLIIGALIGLYVIYQYRKYFWQKSAIPVWLLVGLFAWATFHLIFLSQDFAAQYIEYTTIWKRAAIGAIFALGFGIALANNSFSKKEGRVLWALFYLGLLAPTIIYLIKYFLVHYGIPHGWDVPEYWRLYSGSAPYYLPKTVYLCFCLPTLAVALGQLIHNIQHYQGFVKSNFVYLCSVLAILFLFISENIKNGVIYTAVLLMFFLGRLLSYNFRKNLSAKLVVLGLVVMLGGSLVVKNIQENSSWKSLWADARIALDTQTYDQWKYSGDKGYPTNELGQTVSITNYERMAWGSIGLNLIKENPLGYGIIERSFGHIAKIKWPNSFLTQSHSGWIDLTLGIGLPGLILIFLQFIIFNRYVFLTTASDSSVYYSSVCWIFFSTAIMWLTTELSQRIFFDHLLFWLAIGGGLAFSLTHKVGKSERLVII